MEIVHLKPARAKLKVAIPGVVNGYLPEDGKEVPLTNYWRRRLITGCVVRVETSTASAPMTDSEIDAVPMLDSKKTGKQKPQKA